MTSWLNERRPLTTPQYDALSQAAKDACDVMNARADELHVDGTGAADDIEKVPFHERVMHAKAAAEFSELYVQE